MCSSDLYVPPALPPPPYAQVQVHVHAHVNGHAPSATTEAAAAHSPHWALNNNGDGVAPAEDGAATPMATTTALAAAPPPFHYSTATVCHDYIAKRTQAEQAHIQSRRAVIRMLGK